MNDKSTRNKQASDNESSSQHSSNQGTTEAEHLLRFDPQGEAHVDDGGNPIWDKMGPAYD